MNVQQFISQYKNHPVLFIGTGISLRYLKNSYTWDSLLKKISYELWGNNERYLDIKSGCQDGQGKYDYTKIAQIIEQEFNDFVIKDREGKFRDINDLFYANMENGINLSRFKIYLSELLKETELREEALDEIKELKKIRKNIGSIITTNYDKFIEQTFEFNPLIGNEILLSNPYGSVYKIHGCVSNPSKVIISSQDYQIFNSKYELIRAQLLSLFIHNPIVFMGYSIGDENIKNILKTIFTYIEPNSEQASRIRSNFLLVEYDPNGTSEEIVEHDIDMAGFSTIRINKIKTDNYKAIYKALSNLQLPISAMDVRKVQGIVKEIYSGGSIKVTITEDLDSVKNEDKIIAIGSTKTITYHHQTASEIMQNYFKIIDESNYQILTLIDKHTIHKTQYFPIFGFNHINPDLVSFDKLKGFQEENLGRAIENMKDSCHNKYTTIQEILDDTSISLSNKNNALLWAFIKRQISVDEMEDYLRKFEDKESTNYRKLLCAFDYIKYNQ